MLILGGKASQEIGHKERYSMMNMNIQHQKCSTKRLFRKHPTPKKTLPALPHSPPQMQSFPMPHPCPTLKENLRTRTTCPPDASVHAGRNGGKPGGAHLVKLQGIGTRQDLVDPLGWSTRGGTGTPPGGAHDAVHTARSSALWVLRCHL